MRRLEPGAAAAGVQAATACRHGLRPESALWNRHTSHQQVGFLGSLQASRRLPVTPNASDVLFITGQ